MTATTTQTQLAKDIEALDKVCQAASSDISADIYFNGKDIDFRIKTPAGGWSGYSREQVREILKRTQEIVRCAVQAAADLDKPEVQLKALLKWGEKTAKDASTTGKGRARKDKARPHAPGIRAALATAPPALLEFYSQNPTLDPRVVAAQQDAAAAQPAAPAAQVAVGPPTAAEVNTADFEGLDTSGI